MFQNCKVGVVLEKNGNYISSLKKKSKAWTKKDCRKKNRKWEMEHGINFQYSLWEQTNQNGREEYKPTRAVRENTQTQTHQKKWVFLIEYALNLFGIQLVLI